MSNVLPPVITVLMPVYNSEQLVRAAINSIIKQSFDDFEFLIIDDGSTDNTVGFVESNSDKRIRLIKNEENRGVAWTLNHGLRLARGKYIARMDADDICHHDRLKRQFHFMENNPNVGVAGTWVRYFGDQLSVVERTPSGPDVVKAFMLFDNPLYHPSIMIRKSCLEEYNLEYNPSFNRSEDFELWLRAVEHFDIDNIEKPLLKFRCHDSSVTSTASEVMKKQACDLLKRGLEKLKISVSDDELLFHYVVAKGFRMKSTEELLKAERWLTKLVKRNDQLQIYEPKAFYKVVEMIWYRLCQNSSQLGLAAWQMSRTGLSKGYYQPPIPVKIRFMISILVNSLPGRG